MIKTLLTLKSSTRIAIAVFVISLIVNSIGIGISSIYILDESKNAQCAWEMLSSADHVTPTFNGELRTDKPPLHYYAMMCSYLIFGKSAFAARLFSSVIGALLMVVILLFVTRYAGQRVALWTMVVLWSSIMWTMEFHLAVPDPYLIAFIGFSLMAFFHYSQSRKLWALWAMYACLALGFLAKGPVAVILPAISILIYLFSTGSLAVREIAALKPLKGIILFAVIALPWYILVYRTTGGKWIEGFFWDHNVNRFTNVKEGHGGLFILTLAYFWAGLLPFSVFIVGAVRHFLKRRTDKLILFSGIIAAVFLVFFSVSSTKLPNYAMPCFPFAALLMGAYLNDMVESNSPRRSIVIAFWVLLIISALIPVALTVGVRFEPLLADLKTLGLWLSFLPLTAALSIWLYYNRKFYLAFTTIFTGFFAAIVVIHSVLIPMMDKRNPVSETLDMLKQGREVRYFKTINPSYIFNYGKIRKVESIPEASAFLAGEGNILITSKRAIDDNPELQNRYKQLYVGKDIFDSNTTVILSKP